MRAWFLADWPWLLREDVEELLRDGHRWRYEPCAGARSEPTLGFGPVGAAHALGQIPSQRDLDRARLAARKRPQQHPFKRSVVLAWVENHADDPLLVMASEGSSVADAAVNALTAEL